MGAGRNQIPKTGREKNSKDGWRRKLAGAISHRVRGVGADYSDAVIKEGGVDCGDFDLGHVAGDTVGFADGAGGDCGSLLGLGFVWRRGRLGVAA